ncbi:hypothetical protein [Myroides odoratimimus]|uniref:hypothetical protein n=1 Tax=Myroides odoratimimus TaxID=76832 RepID=UPI002576A13A|nr:hypothetical protein [Myroides odoratimimus]MDM1057883.1 hypothetical protein [Myroides odoratimimus]
MRLISMIEFVLEQSIKRSVDNWPIETEDYFNRCEAYANFLKQPLNLGMFVPCDVNMNVLEDPGLIPSFELNRYREAKERVLFKNCSTIQQGENKIVVCNNIGIWYTWTDKTVEDLIKEKILLTESAIKYF